MTLPMMTPPLCVSGVGAATGMLPSSSQAQTKPTSPSSPDLASLECGGPFEGPCDLKPASPCCGGLGWGGSLFPTGGRLLSLSDFAPKNLLQEGCVCRLFPR